MTSDSIDELIKALLELRHTSLIISDVAVYMPNYAGSYHEGRAEAFDEVISLLRYIEGRVKE